MSYSGLSASGAAKHIRHLATLGLPSRIVIPEMLDALGHVMPTSFNSFFWINPRGDALDAYAPETIVSALAALAETTSADRDPMRDEPSFDKILALGKQVGSARQLHSMLDYSRSTLCNEVWRPYGIGCGLDVILRDGGEARGILFVNRDLRNSRFTIHEYRALESLAPHFRHALTAPDNTSMNFDETEEEIATIMVDRTGDIVSTSENGVWMMLELANLPFERDTFSPERVRRLPDVLLDALRRLVRIRAGRSSLPPSVQTMGRRGLYRARILPHFGIVGANRSTPQDHYSVIISRHLPRELRLSRRLAQLNLSPQERRAAFRVGMGDDSEQGAAALGVTISTWRSYMKSIYGRLDLGSRAELQALLSGALPLRH